MDVNEALEELEVFRSRTHEKSPGVLAELRYGKESVFRVNFFAGHYHVLLDIVVGPRGGLSENAIVIDRFPKEIEVHSLVLSYGGHTMWNNLGTDCIVLSDIGPINKKDPAGTAEKIRTALENLVKEGRERPSRIVMAIEHISTNATNCSVATSRYSMTRG